jgi:hypothetical protein
MLPLRPRPLNASIQIGERLLGNVEVAAAIGVAKKECAARILDPKITLKGDAQNPLQLLVKRIQGNSLKPVRENVQGGDEREDV